MNETDVVPKSSRDSSSRAISNFQNTSKSNPFCHTKTDNQWKHCLSPVTSACALASQSAWKCPSKPIISLGAYAPLSYFRLRDPYLSISEVWLLQFSAPSQPSSDKGNALPNPTTVTNNCPLEKKLAGEWTASCRCQVSQWKRPVLRKDPATALSSWKSGRRPCGTKITSLLDPRWSLDPKEFRNLICEWRSLLEV